MGRKMGKGKRTSRMSSRRRRTGSKQKEKRRRSRRRNTTKKKKGGGSDGFEVGEHIYKMFPTISEGERGFEGEITSISDDGNLTVFFAADESTEIIRATDVDRNGTKTFSESKWDELTSEVSGKGAAQAPRRIKKKNKKEKIKGAITKTKERVERAAARTKAKARTARTSASAAAASAAASAAATLAEIKIGIEHQAEMQGLLGHREDFPSDRAGELLSEQGLSTPPDNFMHGNPTFRDPPRRRRPEPNNRDLQIGPGYLRGTGVMYEPLPPPE